MYIYIHRFIFIDIYIYIYPTETKKTIDITLYPVASIHVFFGFPQPACMYILCKIITNFHSKPDTTHHFFMRAHVTCHWSTIRHNMGVCGSLHCLLAKDVLGDVCAHFRAIFPVVFIALLYFVASSFVCQREIGRTNHCVYPVVIVHHH